MGLLEHHRPGQGHPEPPVVLVHQGQQGHTVLPGPVELRVLLVHREAPALPVQVGVLAHTALPERRGHPVLQGRTVLLGVRVLRVHLGLPVRVEPTEPLGRAGLLAPTELPVQLVLPDLRVVVVHPVHLALTELLAQQVLQEHQGPRVVRVRVVPTAHPVQPALTAPAERPVVLEHMELLARLAPMGPAALREVLGQVERVVLRVPMEPRVHLVQAAPPVRMAQAGQMVLMAPLGLPVLRGVPVPTVHQGLQEVLAQAVRPEPMALRGQREHMERRGLLGLPAQAGLMARVVRQALLGVLGRAVRLGQRERQERLAAPGRLAVQAQREPTEQVELLGVVVAPAPTELPVRRGRTERQERLDHQEPRVQRDQPALRGQVAVRGLREAPVLQV